MSNILHSLSNEHNTAPERAAHVYLRTSGNTKCVSYKQSKCSVVGRINKHRMCFSMPLHYFCISFHSILCSLS